MPQVLVRDLDSVVIQRLKSRARRHRRSLQAELRHILEQAAVGAVGARARIKQIRSMFAGRSFGDSTALIRRDRAR